MWSWGKVNVGSLLAAYVAIAIWSEFNVTQRKHFSSWQKFKKENVQLYADLYREFRSTLWYYSKLSSFKLKLNNLENLDELQCEKPNSSHQNT